MFLGAGTTQTGGGSFWSSGSGRDVFGRDRIPPSKLSNLENGPFNVNKGIVENVPPPFHYSATQDGFTPILPGTVGGFKPIHDPSLNTKNETESVTQFQSEVSNTEQNR